MKLQKRIGQIGEAVLHIALLEPQKLSPGVQRRIEGADIVIDIQDPVLVSQAAGGFNIYLMIISHRHIQGNGIVSHIRVRVKGLQME